MSQTNRIEGEGMYTLVVLPSKETYSLTNLRRLSARFPSVIEFHRFSEGARRLLGDFVRVEVRAEYADLIKANTQDRHLKTALDAVRVRFRNANNPQEI